MGYADLARETNLDDTGSPIDPILGKRLEMILNAAGRTAGRVKQLLDFSRQGKYRHVMVDLHEIIGAVIESIQRSDEDNLLVRCDPCSIPANIKGDPHQIYSALSSISKNAIEAMAEGGTLSISTWIEDASDGHWNSMENHALPAQRIVVAIADTGGGIDESVRRMIFDPFFSTKGRNESIGLGLSSAYGIVKAHGGDIDVDTGENGTTFKLWFPLPVEPESGSEQEQEAIQTRNVDHSH
jgi:signal transduction histidine kinase